MIKKAKKNQLSKYKKILRDLKISHRMVALWIGYTRENTTLIMEGRTCPNKSKADHIEREIKQLIMNVVDVFGEEPNRKEVSLWFDNLSL